MESLLKANMPVSDDDLRLLAYDRGLKVREYLMGKNVEVQRLYVLEPKVVPAGENDKPGAVPLASTMSPSRWQGRPAGRSGRAGRHAAGCGSAGGGHGRCRGSGHGTSSRRSGPQYKAPA